MATAADHATGARTGSDPQTGVGIGVGIRTESTAPGEMTPGTGLELLAKALLNLPHIVVMTFEHATSPRQAAQQSKKPR